jgi:hypothetical protein
VVVEEHLIITLDNQVVLVEEQIEGIPILVVLVQQIKDTLEAVVLLYLVIILVVVEVVLVL